MPLQHDLKNWSPDDVITAEHLNETVQAVRDVEAHLNAQKAGFETGDFRAQTAAVSGAATAGSMNVTGSLTRAGNTVYDTGNKPTPAAIGALSASGGTVSGSLNVTGALSRAGYTVYDTGNKPSPEDVGAGLKKTASIAINGTSTVNMSNYIFPGEWAYLALRSAEPASEYRPDVVMRRDCGDVHSIYIHDISKPYGINTYTQRSGLVLAYRGLSNSNEVAGLSLIGFNIINGGTAVMKWLLTAQSSITITSSTANLYLSGNGFLDIYKPA